MIAKILRHSKSFSGEVYNRLKTQNGKAELMEVRNFDMPGLTGLSGKPDSTLYLDYLNYMADKRPDVKYRQFHVTISCKGRENTKEQLLEAARMYIEEMGYKDQPYLVYFHRDTENNHVHIVTTRVKKDGKLIPDKFEREKSLRAINCINRYFGILDDIHRKAEADVAEALQWRFAFDANFVEILGLKGYKVTKSAVNPKEWQVSFRGEMCATVTQQEIDACKKAYKDGISVRIQGKKPAELQPEIFKRKQLLFTKLTGYASQGLDFGEIKELKELREQLGFEIRSTVKTDKDGKEHIQWSVMDHVGKNVYRGSDIFPVETLARTTDFKQDADHFYALANQVLTEEGPKCPWKTFVSRMEALGYTMHLTRGNVAWGTSKKAVTQFHLPKETVIALLYNQRVENVRRMDIHSAEELAVLAALNRVKADDIRPETFKPYDSILRREAVARLDSVLQHTPNDRLKSALQAEKVAVVSMGRKLYFYQPEAGIIPVANYFTEKPDAKMFRDLGIPVVAVESINRHWQVWEDYLNGHSAGYPSPEDPKDVGFRNRENGQEGAGTGRDTSGERNTDTARTETADNTREHRRRARDYREDGGNDMAPAFSRAMNPGILVDILQTFTQIAQKMKAGSGGGGGGGRRRRRKKGDDDENDT